MVPKTLSCVTLKPSFQSTKPEREVLLRSAKCYFGLRKRIKPPTRWDNESVRRVVQKIKFTAVVSGACRGLALSPQLLYNEASCERMRFQQAESKSCIYKYSTTRQPHYFCIIACLRWWFHVPLIARAALPWYMLPSLLFLDLESEPKPHLPVIKPIQLDRTTANAHCRFSHGKRREKSVSPSALLTVSPHCRSLLVVSPHCRSLLMVSPHGRSLLTVSPHGRSLLTVSPHSQSLLTVPPQGCCLLTVSPLSGPFCPLPGVQLFSLQKELVCFSFLLAPFICCIREKLGECMRFSRRAVWPRVF